LIKVFATYKFVIIKYINTNKHVKKKKKTTNLLIPISKTTNEMYKNIITFKWKDINSNICEITFQNIQKLVDMGLGLEISFHQILLDLHLNQEIYLLALQCTI
jgi:hypothetical protein